MKTEKEEKDPFPYLKIKKELLHIPQAKEMLVTGKKFKNLEKIKSFDTSKKNIKRVDIKIPNSRVFLLENLLSKQECEILIKKSEELGYSSLSDLFPSEYRQNDRLMTKSEWLADLLYKRVQPHFKKDDILRLIPVGFGNQGTWKPTRFNECIKFSKTGENQFFKPHIDGPWIPRDEEMSIYTMVVYLNDDYEGGKTNFLKEGKFSSIQGGLHSVVPKQGMALLFTHDTIHEGECVSQGTKYILRTELLFERVDKETQANIYSYTNDDNYLKSVALYQKSVSYELKDSKIFKDSYFESLKLMVDNQMSVDEKYIGKLKNQILPYDVMVYLFHYIDAENLYKILTVNKAWYDTIRDSDIWKFHFSQRWKIELDESPSITKDWFEYFNQILNLKNSVPVVVDMGSYFFKFGSYNGSTSLHLNKVENYVGVMTNAVHYRRYEFDETYVGKNAIYAYNVEGIERAVDNGVVRLEIIPELFCYLFQKLNLKSRSSHLLLIEPFTCWSNTEKSGICDRLFSLFRVNMIAFVHPAICVLQNYNAISGMVISLGSKIGCISLVFQGEVLMKYLKKVDVKITETELKKEVESLMKNFPKNIQEVFKSNTILCKGGYNYHKKLEGLLPDFNIQLQNDEFFEAIKGGLIYEKKVKKSEKMWKRYYKFEGRDGEFYYDVLVATDYYWKKQIVGNEKFF